MDCPKCGGPAADLRGCGFNPANLERERTCYWWSVDTYTCNRPDAARRGPMAGVLGEWLHHEGQPGDRPRPIVLTEAAKAEALANLDKYLAALERIE